MFRSSARIYQYPMYRKGKIEVIFQLSNLHKLTGLIDILLPTFVYLYKIHRTHLSIVTMNYLTNSFYIVCVEDQSDCEWPQRAEGMKGRCSSKYHMNFRLPGDTSVCSSSLASCRHRRIFLVCGPRKVDIWTNNWHEKKERENAQESSIFMEVATDVSGAECKLRFSRLRPNSTGWWIWKHQKAWLTIK